MLEESVHPVQDLTGKMTKNILNQNNSFIVQWTLVIVDLSVSSIMSILRRKFGQICPL